MARAFQTGLTLIGIGMSMLSGLAAPVWAAGDMPSSGKVQPAAAPGVEVELGVAMLG